MPNKTIKKPQEPEVQYGTCTQRVQAASAVTNPIATANSIVMKATESPSEEETRFLALSNALKNLSVGVYDDIPADVNTISINGTQTFAREGIQFVKAKAKQGKSSMLAIIEAISISIGGQWGKLSRIGSQPLKVRHVDTEQKLYDTQRFKKQVFRIAGMSEEEVGDNYGVINIRGKIDNNEKKELIEAYVAIDKPDVLVIDGIVDLLNNFNDVEESKILMAWLMYLASKYKVVLFCVLHTNKNSMDHNMRGHLGTMSEQKCDNTIECEKDDSSGIVNVKCASSRHCPFDDWHFTWDSDGNLIDAEAQHLENIRHKTEEMKMAREQKSQEINDSRKNKMISIIKQNGGNISRKKLTELLETELGLSRQTVSPLITSWINEQVIYEDQKMIQTSPQANIYFSGDNE